MSIPEYLSTVSLKAASSFFRRFGSAGLTAEALDRHCLDSPDLANFKRPRRIVFVSELPKTASGKILRRLLRDGRDTETRRHE